LTIPGLDFVSDAHHSIFLFLILKSSFYEKIAGSIMIALSNCGETNSYANVTASKPKALWFINISGERRKEKGIGICQLISRIKRQAFGICAWTARKEHRKGSRQNNLSDSKSGAALIKHKVEKHCNHYQSNHPQPLPINCNVMPIFQS